VSRREVTWEMPLVVKLSPAARRVVAKKLGKRGEVSREDMEEVVAQVVFDWLAGILAEGTP
jgi:uncharacterized membrane protein YqiK